MQSQIVQLDQWNMKFNVSKCELRCETTIMDQSYTLNGMPITATPTCKDVGILNIISSNSFFISHLHHIISEAYKSVGML